MYEDKALTSLKDPILKDGNCQDSTDSNVVLRFDGRLCVPRVRGLILLILYEAYDTKYSIYSNTMMMYHNIRENLWWDEITTDINDYVSSCLSCHQVKVEHQRPSEKLQRSPIPKWKWDWITMDFLIGSPCNSSGIDSICFIID